MPIDDQELEMKVREILMRILSETRLPVSGTTAVVPSPGTTIHIYTGPVTTAAGAGPDIEPHCVPICHCADSIGFVGVVAELPLDDKSNALLEKIERVTGQSRSEVLQETERRIVERERAAQVAAEIQSLAEELGIVGGEEK